MLQQKTCRTCLKKIWVGDRSLSRDDSSKGLAPCLSSSRSPRLFPRGPSINRQLRLCSAESANHGPQGPRCAAGDPRKWLRLSAHRRHRPRPPITLPLLPPILLPRRRRHLLLPLLPPLLLLRLPLHRTRPRKKEAKPSRSRARRPKSNGKGAAPCEDSNNRSSSRRSEKRRRNSTSSSSNLRPCRSRRRPCGCPRASPPSSAPPRRGSSSASAARSTACPRRARSTACCSGATRCFCSAAAARASGSPSAAL